MAIEMATLVFFEHHHNSGSKDFIIKYIQQFKRLGYQTVMLELPNNVGLRDIRALYEKGLADINRLEASLEQQGSTYKDTLIKHHKYTPLQAQETVMRKDYHYKYLELCNAIELAGMELRGCENPQLYQQASLAARSNQEQAAIATVKSRDVAMAENISAECHRQNGGVLLIVGFAHNSLIPLLSQKQVETKPIMIDNELQTAHLTDVLNNRPHQSWITLLTEPNVRKAFYQQETSCFNEQTSFDTFCQEIFPLPVLTPCQEMPNLGRIFNNATGLNFAYSSSEAHVLYAHLSHENAEAVDTVRQVINYALPSLPTFFNQAAHSSTLTIQGLNLPEHQEKLRAFFN